MAERNPDVLVMWDPANIRYFSGFHSLHWSSLTISQAVYPLPLEREPIIAVSDFFSGVAQGYICREDIRLQPKPHITKNIRQVPVDIADTVKDLGCGRGRIGIVCGRQVRSRRPLSPASLNRFNHL